MVESLGKSLSQIMHASESGHFSRLRGWVKENDPDLYAEIRFVSIGSGVRALCDRYHIEQPMPGEYLNDVCKRILEELENG